MKIISHRGNIDGPNSLTENQPEIIDKAIQSGYDVEIDIRFDKLNNIFYLGHDEPQYKIDFSWLVEHKDYLWVHCKNLECLYQFSLDFNDFNYFWHQTDDFTLTSKNYIWTYPGKENTPNSVIVMPENNLKLIDFDVIKRYNVYGICTDHPNLL